MTSNFCRKLREGMLRKKKHIVLTFNYKLKRGANPGKWRQDIGKVIRVYLQKKVQENANRRGKRNKVSGEHVISGWEKMEETDERKERKL